MDFEDKKLIADFLDGDNEALEALLKKYLKPVFNFILRLVKSVPVAEDLTQETFIKVWRNIDKFDSSKSHFAALRNRQNRNLAPYGTEGSRSGFKIWLFTIAKNTAYDYLKKKKTIPFAYFENAEGNNILENVKADIAKPEELLDANIDFKKLNTALKKIPAHYREVLLLCYREDFTLNEISEILGEPYNTVKSRHARGLEKLKNLII